MLEKKIGVNQPKRMENCKILVANTQMDTDKIKIFGSKVRVDSSAKIAEIEEAEKVRVNENAKKATPALLTFTYSNLLILCATLYYLLAYVPVICLSACLFAYTDAFYYPLLLSLYRRDYTHPL